MQPIVLGLAEVLRGAGTILAGEGRFRRWPAPLTGISPVFVGTFGVHCTALASI